MAAGKAKGEGGARRKKAEDLGVGVLCFVVPPETTANLWLTLSEKHRELSELVRAFVCVCEVITHDLHSLTLVSALLINSLKAQTPCALSPPAVTLINRQINKTKT